MSAQEVEYCFPKLVADGYKPTSSDTSDYNCIAWAAHNQTEWWWPWPYKIHGYYWPDNIPRNREVATFIELYRQECGFEVCESGELENGFEKIAIYAAQNKQVTHAARQTPSGVWTSKLGNLDDIEHNTLTSLEDEGMKDTDYGKVIKFLKRKLPGTAVT